MDTQKVIEELSRKYPKKRILDNAGEIVCETGPAPSPGESGTAVAVIDKSKPHYHKKTIETYKVLKGELKVFVNKVPHKLGEGDELVVNPGEIHYAIGDETWVEVASVPGWRPGDHFLTD